MADREDYIGLSRDLGGLRVTMDVIRLGHAVHVQKVALEVADREHVALDRQNLEVLGRGLNRLAEDMLAEHLSTQVEMPPEPAVLTLTAPDGRSVTVRGTAGITRTDPRERQQHADAFAKARRARLTEEDFERVADIVLRAQAEGRPIQRAVHEEWPCSESRAGHLIKMTRDRGHLPPAPRKGRKP